MRLSFSIPDKLLNYYGSENLEKDLKLHHALILFMRGEISLSMAAEFSDVSIYDFIFECEKNKIPVYNITPEDLENEINSIDF